MQETIVLQRIRNGIIDYLELASSFESQREYQARAPVHVPNEVLNQWEDSGPQPRDFGPPVFSRAECEAIAAYDAVWRTVADSTPDSLPALDACIRLPAWVALRDAAASALRVFRQRGRSPEDPSARS